MKLIILLEIEVGVYLEIYTEVLCVQLRHKANPINPLLQVMCVNCQMISYK